MVLSDRENKMGESSAAMKDVSRNVVGEGSAMVLDGGGINIRNIMGRAEEWMAYTTLIHWSGVSSV